MASALHGGPGDCLGPLRVSGPARTPVFGTSATEIGQMLRTGAAAAPERAHSTLMLASLISAAHFVVSVRRNERKSSGLPLDQSMFID